jgi:hypothetical protein
VEQLLFFLRFGFSGVIFWVYTPVLGLHGLCYGEVPCAPGMQATSLPLQQSGLVYPVPVGVTFSMQFDG